jgi:hypothetical protein
VYGLEPLDTELSKSTDCPVEIVVSPEGEVIFTVSSFTPQKSHPVISSTAEKIPIARVIIDSLALSIDYTPWYISVFIYRILMAPLPRGQSTRG